MGRYATNLSIKALLAASVLALSAVGPAAAQDDDIRIGYLSGGDADPFVFLVTQSVQDAAIEAGVELFACDANFNDETALTCARNIGAADVDAVINWHFTAAASPGLCAAYNELPTVSLDTQQDPCHRVFVGADGQTAGLVAGEALGQWTEANIGCDTYDLYISIVNLNLPDIVAQRDGGSREGFESVCGAIPEEKSIIVNKTEGGDDRAANVRRIITDQLTINSDATNIIVMASFGDGDGIVTSAAAAAAGRADHVWIASHGADPSVCTNIRTDPQWVGSVAYFPERYGALAVPAAIGLARGEEVPEKIFPDHQFVTADNIDSIYPDCL